VIELAGRPEFASALLHEEGARLLSWAHREALAVQRSGRGLLAAVRARSGRAQSGRAGAELGVIELAGRPEFASALLHEEGARLLSWAHREALAVQRSGRELHALAHGALLQGQHRTFAAALPGGLDLSLVLNLPHHLLDVHGGIVAVQQRLRRVVLDQKARQLLVQAPGLERQPRSRAFRSPKVLHDDLAEVLGHRGRGLEPPGCEGLPKLGLVGVQEDTRAPLAIREGSTILGITDQ